MLIAYFWNAEINLLFCVLLLQVQSTSWMPHQQYVMQPTVSAPPVLPAAALSLLSPVCAALGQTCQERKSQLKKKKVYSLHFPKNNLALCLLLFKLERNCSWIDTSNHVSAPLRVIESKVKQFHPCRNYSSAA